MKKILSFFLFIIVLVQLTACNERQSVKSENLQIVTTVFPLYDFARTVAGDKAEVTLLLPVGAEAHSYEPTVQDVIKIKECDLFLNIGKSAEPWIESIVEEDSFKGSSLSAMDCAELIEESHSHNNHYEYDQHVWTSIENAEDIVEGISEVLERVDVKNARYYERNAESYIDRLDLLDEKFEKLTERINKPIIFADRFPFRYFVDDYDLAYFAAYPGCSAESEPSAATVAELIDKVRAENIDVIFYTETSNGQLPDSICEETGAEKKLLHSCHTVTKKQLEEGVTYLDLMEENYNSIKSAL